MLVAKEQPARNKRSMRLAITAFLLLASVACHEADGSVSQSSASSQYALSNEDFVGFKESHPGMLPGCLDKVRSEGFIAWEPDDPACYEMLPPQRWSGLWEHGWEWTNFCPEPAEECDWMLKRGIWLTFSDEARLDRDLPDGVHKIEFVGRRTKVPGNFGHQAFYEHLMVVDRIVSIEPAEGVE